MKRLPAMVLAASFMATSVLADENNDSAVDSKWAFGLQAGSTIFGLSLRRELTDNWQLQGVALPVSQDEFLVGGRVLRTATQKEFWRSYSFAGIAHFNGNDTGFLASGSDRNITGLSTGFGVEWSWKVRNQSFPPLAWNLEIGLGYVTEDIDDDSSDEDGEVFLALGAGIHYQFD